MNVESKKEFILLLKSGDESAFTALRNKYNRRLFAYAISLSGDYSLAKDIVQDVFVKTFEYRKKLNPEFSIEGFLFRCVYNQFINTYHKNKSLLKVHDEYVRFLNQMIDETSNSEFDKLIKVVNDSIKNLPKRCKEILTTAWVFVFRDPTLMKMTNEDCVLDPRATLSRKTKIKT